MKTRTFLIKSCSILFISVLIFLTNLNAQKSTIDSIKTTLDFFQKSISDSAINEKVNDAQTLAKADTRSDTLRIKLLELEEALFRTEQVTKKEVLKFFLLVRHLVDKSQGRKWQHIMWALNNLGLMYTSMGENQKALLLYLDALLIIKNNRGEENDDYYKCLNNLAWFYKNNGFYTKADSSYQRVLEIIKAVKGEENSDYAAGLDGLAGLYKELDEYEKSVTLYQRALGINARLDENNRDYAIGLTNLSDLYVSMGFYDKALPLYLKSLAIIKSLFGQQNNDYTSTLHNLAYLYEKLALYEKALSLYQYFIPIDKEALGEENPDYALSLNDLAFLYDEDLGLYDKALPLYQQALAIIKKVKGEEHIEYATILGNLAGMYERMGQYSRALLLYKKVLSITGNALGKETTDYARCLSNLADSYKRMGLYKKALPLFQQVLLINKMKLHEKHPVYATSLNNLASLYSDMGLYKQALPLLQQALIIRKNVLGENHRDYATSLNSFAGYYEKTGQYKQALSLYQQAITIRRNILGATHPEYASSLNNAGLTYALFKNKNAIDLIAEAHKIRLQNTAANISTLSEKEKLTLLLAESSKFDFLPSLLFISKSNDAGILNQLYTSELILKGMVLQDQQNILRNIRKIADSALEQKYEQWKFNKKVVGKQLLLPINKRVAYLDSLQHEINELEQILSRQSAAFSKQQQTQSITVNEIRKKLLEGEAAIEFTRFQLYNKKWKDSILYAALLLLPGDSAVKFIPLFEENQLQRLLVSRGFENVEAPLAKLSRGTSSTPFTLNNDSLYLLMWKPLEKYLSNVNTVYYAPAGLMNRVAFQALKLSSGDLLINKYHLNQVLSTRSVVIKSEASNNLSLVNIWGNIQYDLADNPPNKKNIKYQQGLDTTSTFNFYTSDTRGIRREGFISLPGASLEVQRLKKLLEPANISTIIDSGANATEERFKNIDGNSPQVLHVATHGFFLPIKKKKANDFSDPDLNKNPFIVQENPMFRSGIVLAGGNHAWRGYPVSPGKEDGILTAYEIAQMDLSKTDLVVLSACETALGDVQGSEGVIGLQRAFKIAGVKQIVMSLWQVPDKATMELMTMFYINRLSGQSAREALRSAQLKMKEKYPPYYWAAFVLVE